MFFSGKLDKQTVLHVCNRVKRIKLNKKNKRIVDKLNNLDETQWKKNLSETTPSKTVSKIGDCMISLACLSWKDKSRVAKGYRDFGPRRRCGYKVEMTMEIFGLRDCF